ncbi:MAG: HDIG domain-containing protein [Clostridia bacterium]|nr:HDIG domain-containing protein [Clostridia bacterium]
MKPIKTQWNKQQAIKSIVLFLVYFALLALLSFFLLVGTRLNSLSVVMRENGSRYLYALCCLFLLVAITYVYFFFENRGILMSGKNTALLFCVLGLQIGVSFGVGQMNIYMRPVALVSLLTLMLLGRREAAFMTVIAALAMFVLDNASGADAYTQKEIYASLLIAFSSGIVSIFACACAKTRFRIILVGFIILIPVLFIIALLELTLFVSPEALQGTLPTAEYIFIQMGYGVIGGISSTVLFLAILPIFEWMFNCLTVYRLRELTSHDSRLLRKLRTEAPGTFNHSVSVAQLAESCAAALGENADFARAAAYYHDVGKLHQPEYFTENQGDYNLHDELTPELSADIIRSHAHDGYELIRSHHLPQLFADVALQHHGTLPIRYFYAKALKMTDGELNIEDFSYSGPKPQTRIAAIIMIADAAEASVRALPNRTQETVEEAVRKIIEERMELEQFSECAITMQDLALIRRTLVDTLTGVYHRRVSYPGLRYKKGKDGKTEGENE